jgi:hypothetical protein
MAAAAACVYPLSDVLRVSVPVLLGQDQPRVLAGGRHPKAAEVLKLGRELLREFFFLWLVSKVKSREETSPAEMAELQLKNIWL